MRDERIENLVDQYPVTNNDLNDPSFENVPQVKNCLSILNIFYAIFKDDPMLDAKSRLRELQREYFVISLYLLLRHLNRYYALTTTRYPAFHEFVVQFHKLLREKNSSDLEMLRFRENRQQSKEDLETET